MKRLIVLGAAVCSIFFIVRCGSSGGSSSDNSAAIPQLAIASPMAANTTTRTRGADADTATDVKPYATAKEELKDILKKDTAAGCFLGLGFKSFSKTVNCYGPQLVVFDHPNGNFGGPSASACPNPPVTNAAGAVGTNDGCLPGGDLGMWTATEGATEACAAAKLNELVGDVAETVNNAMKFMAAMTCASGLAGKALPAVGVTLDIASDVKAAFPGATVTTATITREADYTGTTDPVYKLVLQAAVSTKEFKITLINSSSGTDKFRGRLFGYHTAGGSPAGNRGFSAIYEQTSATDLKVVTKMGITPTATATSTLHNTSGDYDFTVFTAAPGAGNARYLSANLSPTTGLGSVKFAWQAGSGDSKTRVFNATVSRARDNRTDTGVAYFGFGPKVSVGPLGQIDGMCCNWAGPGGGNCAGTLPTTDRQGQTFTRAAATDVFTPVTNHLLYAPTNSCSYISGGGFKFGTVTEWGTTGGSVSDVTVAELLCPADFLGTVPAITDPTFAP